MADTYPGYAPAESYAGYGSRDWRNRLALELLRKQQNPITSLGGGINEASKNFRDWMLMQNINESERARDAGLVRTANARPPPGASSAVATGVPPRSGLPVPAPQPPDPFRGVEVRPDSYGTLPRLPSADQDPFARWGLSQSPFDDASPPQPPAAMSTAQSADETVPLPPPRPVYDRNRRNAELEANPELKQRLLTIAAGESNDPRVQKAVLETAFNRAEARDTSLARETGQYTGPGSRGYYPAGSFRRGQADPQLLTDVMRGSDVGGEALGYAPTGNASGGVAARGIASGRYGNAGRIGDETFVTQEPPEQLARLAASRVPGAPLDIMPQEQTAAVPFTNVRDAITAAVMPPPPAPPVRMAGPGVPAAPDVAPPAPAPPARNPMIVRPDITPLPTKPEPMPAEVTPRSRGIPPAPVKNERLTEDELYGWSIIRAHPGDPDYKAIGESYIKSGKEQRDAEYARQVKEWEAKVEIAKKYEEQAGAHELAGQERRQKAITDYTNYLKSFREMREKTPQEAPAPGEGVPGEQLNPALGTPASPQRTGPRIPEVPPGTVPEKWREVQAPMLAKDIEAYDKALPKFNRMLVTIEEARRHPGYATGLGALGTIARNTPQTAAFGFDAIVNQIKGKNFLEAYQDLRGGGGNISNIEGAKAEQSQARIDPRQREVDFRNSLTELENSVRGDLETAQRKLNLPVTAWRKPGDNTSFAPDKGEVRTDFSDGIAREYVGGNPYDIKNSWRPARR